MTRGADTFSIANDVAKSSRSSGDFCRVLSAARVLNVMHLQTGERDPFRNYLQRADHHRADPVEPARRDLRPAGAAALLRRNC